MTGTNVRLAAAAMCVLAGVAGPQPLRAAIILDTVTIRVYDGAGVTPEDRAAALKGAAAIFARADLYVDWIVCTGHREARQHSACDSAPSAHELVVRLTNSSPVEQDGKRRAFGYTLIDAASGRGTMSTVFVDRVDWLAANAKAARPQVLGRAIAHELGHLILGSNAHADRGLMREVWTFEELIRNRPDDWQFSTGQRASLRAKWVGGSGAPAHRAASPDPRTSSSVPGGE